MELHSGSSRAVVRGPWTVPPHEKASPRLVLQRVARRVSLATLLLSRRPATRSVVAQPSGIHSSTSAASGNVRLVGLTGRPSRLPARPLRLAPWRARLAPEPLAHGRRAQGAPAAWLLARAVARRGGGRQAHAPSLAQPVPSLASPTQVRPPSSLPTPEWLSSLRQPPEHEQGEGCLNQH